MTELDKNNALMNEDWQTFIALYPEGKLAQLFKEYSSEHYSIQIVQKGQEDSAVEEQLQKLGLGELEIAWLKNRAESNNLSLCQYTADLLEASARINLMKFMTEMNQEVGHEDRLGPGIQEKSRDFSRDNDLSR